MYSRHHDDDDSKDDDDHLDLYPHDDDDDYDDESVGSCGDSDQKQLRESCRRVHWSVT